MGDMQKRKKDAAKKESSANAARLKGNNHYKRGNLGDALREYRESLKQQPYDPKTLLNIVQVCIKQKDYEDALEFLARTLYINDKQPKAWCRKAFVLSELKRYDDALAASKRAYALDPESTDISVQFEELTIKVNDQIEEERLKKLLGDYGQGQGQGFEHDADEPDKQSTSVDSISDSDGGSAAESKPPQQQQQQQGSKANVPGHYGLVDSVMTALRQVYTVDPASAIYTEQLIASGTAFKDQVQALLAIMVPPKDATGVTTTAATTVIKEVKLYMRVQQYPSVTSIGISNTLNNVTTQQNAAATTNGIGLLTSYLTKFMAMNMSSPTASSAVTTASLLVSMNYSVLELLLLVCLDEKANSTQLYDTKFLHLIKDYLVGYVSYKSSFSSEHVDQLLFFRVGIDLFSNVYFVCNKTRSYIHSQLASLLDSFKHALLRVHMILHNLHLNPTSIASASNTSLVNALLGVSEKIHSFLKTLLFNTDGKKYFSEQMLLVNGAANKTVHPNMVFFVGYAIRVIHLMYVATVGKGKKASKPKANLFTHLMELGVDVLVGYSQFSAPPSSTVTATATNASTAGMSMYVELRNMYIQTYNSDALHMLLNIPVPPVSTIANTATSTSVGSVSFTVIDSLLDVNDVCPHYETNVLAVLMNISIDNSGITSVSINAKSVPEKIATSQAATMSLRDALCANTSGASAGGSSSKVVQLAVSAITEPAVSITVDTVNNSARKLGLLSRLITNTDVQKLVLQPANYTMLCQHLVRCMKTLAISEGTPFPAEISAPSPGSGYPVVVNQEELTYIVRVLATVAPVVVELSKTHDIYKTITLKESVLQSIVIAVFPTVRTEIGEYTANSVIQSPKLFVDNVKNTTSISNNAVRSLLIGNTARILLSFAGWEQGCSVLFDQRELAGVEKFVCAMATCSDIRVRKNIAILLAKGCKHSTATRELVTKYRGVQMMIELQDKF